MTARVWAPVVAVIVLAVIAAFVALVLNRRKNLQENLKNGRALRGDLSQKQEQELMAQVDSAANLLDRLVNGTNIETASFVSDKHREMVAAWQRNYNSLIAKIGWIRVRDRY